MTGADKLIKLYETAMKELYREIAYREYRGNATGYQRRLLEQVQAILKRLKRQTPGAVTEALKPAYLTGIRSFVKDIETTVGITLDPQIPWRQLNILIQNTTDQLTLATNRVGRIWQDAIRRAGIEATKHKLATGQTVDQMRRQLLTELMNINPRGRDGQTGIITKRGTMRLDSYAALVARSTTAEAQNASKIEMAREHGYDLAHFTKHSPTCGVCAQHEDRMYALTKEAANGKYKGPNGEPLHFPYLYDTAFVSGYDNIHPNCIHRLVIAVPEFMKPDELAVWSRKSMRPFEDTRSERDRKAYARIQADNRSRWQDRRQWERYRAVLPDQTPANFGAFRVMKKANTQRWIDLRTDYNYVAKRLKSGIIDIGSGAVGMDIEIDKLTPCLAERVTGKIVDTRYSKAEPQELKALKKKGWNFNWNASDLRDTTVYKLMLDNDDAIQGLVAITDMPNDYSIHLKLAESAPHNLGTDKKYEGVGGHLFAIAAKESLEKGYGGFLFFEAKNVDLVNHYQKAFGGRVIGGVHQYRMIIDEDAAARLLKKYTLNGGE